MKIVLCLKQVPDTSDIKWTENNTIQREGLESIINPYDLYALECALKLKKEKNAHITAISMGPNQAQSVLRKALSTGVDNAVLLSDKKFSGADTYATAKTIAGAIKQKLENFDLVICGQFAVDGDTAQTGPSIANFLDIPQVTYVKQITECTDKTVTLIRELDEGYETVQVELPALICILKGDNDTTRPTINGIKYAQDAKIETLGIEELHLTPEEVGIKGSPTYVSKAFRAAKRNIECNFVEEAEELLNLINDCRRSADE